MGLERENILSEIIKSLDKCLYINNSSIINEWMRLCAHNNKKILISDNNQYENGEFVGINLDGKALINIDGKITSYSNGMIEL